MCFLPKKERDHDYNINTVRNFIVTRQKVHSPSAPCKHETLELKEKYAHVILGLVEHNHGDWSFCKLWSCVGTPKYNGNEGGDV